MYECKYIVYVFIIINVRIHLNICKSCVGIKSSLTGLTQIHVSVPEV